MSSLFLEWGNPRTAGTGGQQWEDTQGQPVSFRSPVANPSASRHRNQRWFGLVPLLDRCNAACECACGVDGPLARLGREADSQFVRAAAVDVEHLARYEHHSIPERFALDVRS